jgi:hypothetical protein
MSPLVRHEFAFCCRVLALAIARLLDSAKSMGRPVLRSAEDHAVTSGMSELPTPSILR